MRKAAFVTTSFGVAAVLALLAVGGPTAAAAAPTPTPTAGASVPPPAIPTSAPTNIPFIGGQPATSGPPTQEFGVKVDIPMSDGVVLKGSLSVPRTPGKHPAIVVINAWGGYDVQDAAVCNALVARGYVAVEFAPRGVGSSGGQNDVGGPRTVKDVSEVIDWLLKNSPTDPDRIGTTGISYGAGIGMLAAAKDKRIRAVAAMSGWENLQTAIYPHDTFSGFVVAALQIFGQLGGVLSPETIKIFQDVQQHKDTAAVLAWAHDRSPSTYLAQLNANKPAVFLASASTEHVFPIGQTADLFTALTTPKRLEMRGGEHAYVEGSGVWGFDNPVYDSAYSWFDTYVAGTSTAGRTEPQVYWMPRSPHGNIAAEQYPDLAAASTRTERLPLGGRSLLSATGNLGGSPTAWATKIAAGLGTAADAGVPLLTQGIETFSGTPTTTWIPSILPVNGSVWQSAAYKTGLKLRGRAAVRLTVTPSTAAGTIFVYLYAEDPLGIGSYITHEPYSWTGATPGKPMTIDLPMEPMSFDVPAGDRVALAIDTKDAMYYDNSQLGSTLTFSSSKAAPSYLDLPVR